MSADPSLTARIAGIDSGISHAELDQLIGTAVAAFRDDPLYRWLQPNPVARVELLRENFHLTLEAGARNAELWSPPDGSGFAAWSLPGGTLLSTDDVRVFADMLAHHAGARAAEAMVGMSECAALEPDQPHATLHLVAVHPRCQRRGLGAHLLASVLDHCDGDGVSVWLESSNPANLGFYESLGFRATGSIQLPNGPAIVTMLRPASDGRGRRGDR